MTLDIVTLAVAKLGFSPGVALWLLVAILVGSSKSRARNSNAVTGK
jgi:hypothetical protein